MTPADIAAYIGAAAWVPQIVGWIYKKFTKPIVTVILNDNAEVGFTNHGPTFRVAMAILAEKKALMLSGLDLILQHSDGDIHTLRWAEFTENFSATTDISGNRQTTYPSQPAIALNISTDSLVEKSVFFQEPRYRETFNPAMSKLVSHLNFLLFNKPDNYKSEVFSSKEFHEAVNVHEKSFWWKHGRYHVSLILYSSQTLEIRPLYSYYFDFDDTDISILKTNIAKFKEDLKGSLSDGLPVKWNNMNFTLKKIDVSDK